MRELIYATTKGSILVQYPSWMDPIIKKVLMSVRIKILNEIEFKGKKMSTIIIDEFIIEEKQ